MVASTPTTSPEADPKAKEASAPQRSPGRTGSFSSLLDEPTQELGPATDLAQEIGAAQAERAASEERTREASEAAEAREEEVAREAAEAVAAREARDADRTSGGPAAPDPTASQTASAPAAPASEPARGASGRSPGQNPSPTQDAGQSLPVAVEPVRREPPKPSLWRRIALFREARRRRESEQQLAGQRNQERLDQLDERLGELRRELVGRLDRLEERWTEVWGVEEQLSRVAEMGEALEALRRHLKQQRADLQSLRSGIRLLGFSTALLSAVAAIALVMLAAGGPL